MTAKPGRLPEQYVSIKRRFGTYFAALEDFGRAARECGPLDAKTAHLVQLGAAAAIRSEGAVHSHARRALEEGATADELHHAIIVISSTVGFPNVSAALSWIDDVLDRKKG